MIPRLVMIGTAGCGKTTLLNKICNKQLKTYCGGRQDTIEPIISQSAYGKGFLLLDAPGFGGFKNLNISIGTLKCLIESPINQLLVVCKFDLFWRSELGKIITMFDRFKDIITVIITFFDLSQDQLQSREEITHYLKNRRVESVIFKSNDTHGEELCKLIDRITTNSEQKRKFELMQSEILLNFIHHNYEDEQIFFNLEYIKYSLIAEFKTIRSCYEKQIQQLPNTHPNLSEVMHKVILSIKDQAKNQFEEFKKKTIDLFEQIYKSQDKDFVFLIDFEIKKALFGDIYMVIQQAFKKIQCCDNSYINNIKQCPYCGVIWMKESGCNILKCGQYDTKSKSYFYVDRGLGCKKQLRWNEMISFSEYYIQEASQIEVESYLLSELAQQMNTNFIEKIQNLINDKKIIFV